MRLFNHNIEAEDMYDKVRVNLMKKEPKYQLGSKHSVGSISYSSKSGESEEPEE